MPYEKKPLTRYNHEFSKLYKKRKIILSFDQFIDLVSENPYPYMRDSAHYISDVFLYHEQREVKHFDSISMKRYCLFDFISERNNGIVGCEQAHSELFNYLVKFRRKGFVDKLILLHGPNGSAKSSTVEKIAHGMELYSHKPEGAVYKFNWMFPIGVEEIQGRGSKQQPIGFSSEPTEGLDTYAFLNEQQTLTRVQSEFKENPLFLIPMPYRENFLRRILAKKQKISPKKVIVPPHLLQNGLSKKNQEIFENLQHLYQGDLLKLYRHIQVERFFYSYQYRVGISSVDPQLSVDAHEKQITMDINYSKLPSYLQHTSFYESSGELVEANRGLIEYSDLLSRHMENFKYLLNTIERGLLKLPSGIAHLDLVYVATTNDKHLDAFKRTPEFNSFKGRFEFINVPYLLKPSEEKIIYADDVSSLESEINIGPHVIDLLSIWAVMTRLKPCCLSLYEPGDHDLLKKMNPRLKAKLYDGECLQKDFTLDEEARLTALQGKIWDESQGSVVYEGRFGVSPRDVRTLLHKAAQKAEHQCLTPMVLFDELRSFIKNKSVYEFLQIKPEGFYFNNDFFIACLEEEYERLFKDDLINAMNIANKKEYRIFLERYIKNVVAYIKREKILNESTNSYEKPSEKIMEIVEKILGVTGSVESHRSNLLNKIAASKLENPKKVIKIEELFHLQLTKIKNHFFSENKKVIENNLQSMLKAFQGNPCDEKDLKEAKQTYRRMWKDHGYSEYAVYKSIQALVEKQTLPVICS